MGKIGSCATESSGRSQVSFKDIAIPLHRWRFCLTPFADAPYNSIAHEPIIFGVSHMRLQFRLKKRAAPDYALLVVLMGTAVSVGQSAPFAHTDIVIKNATVMTVTHGNIMHGSIYIKD